MADEGRAREAQEMRDAGHQEAAAVHLIEGLIDTDDGSSFPEEDREPEDVEEIEEEPEAEDDASEESEDVEVEDVDDDEDSDEETSDDAEDEDLAHLELDEDALDSLVTVKVDGEEREVSLREALAGYQRQTAFTRKTQELAEQRKAVQQEIQERRAERQKLAEKIGEVESVLGAFLPENEPDWEAIKAERPDSYPDEFRQHQEFKKMVQAAREQREALQSEAQQEALGEYQRLSAERDEFLVSTVPGWEDVSKARAEMAELVEYASENYGMTHETLSNTVDPQAFLILRKAKLYDEMQEKGETVRKKAKKTVRLKPGSKEGKVSSKDKKLKAAKSRLSKTGSLRDAAAVLEHMGLVD